MAPTAHRVGWVARLTVTLSAVWAPGATAGPAPEPPQPRCTVQQVEVPVAVPVDDTTSEALQVAIAAALGVGLTYVAARLREPRSRAERTTAGIIDITDVVQSRFP